MTKELNQAVRYVDFVIVDLSTKVRQTHIWRCGRSVAKQIMLLYSQFVSPKENFDFKVIRKEEKDETDAD